MFLTMTLIIIKGMAGFNKRLLLFNIFSTSFLVMDGHMMRIFSVMYLPNDDNVFLSGGWDDTLQVRKEEKGSTKSRLHRFGFSAPY